MKLKVMIFTFVLVCSTVCHASWLTYHKPEYRGKIVDIETGQPIEGALVIAFYQKETINPPVESFTSTIHVKEALTDKQGNYRIPSYSTLISPLSWSGDVMLLIYKPGYLCFGRAAFLSQQLDQDIELSEIWNKKLKYKVTTSGTVMLPKAQNYNDRYRSLLNLEISEFYSELPIGKKMQSDEREYLDSIQKR